jgi:hypothetical protein
VGRETLSRWIGKTLKDAGIDTHTFKTHSTRAASTSKMKAVGVPIDDILKCGGWSNAKTFARFYDRPITAGNAAEVVLCALPAHGPYGWG